MNDQEWDFYDALTRYVEDPVDQSCIGRLAAREGIEVSNTVMPVLVLFLGFCIGQVCSCCFRALEDTSSVGPEVPFLSSTAAPSRRRSISGQSYLQGVRLG